MRRFPFYRQLDGKDCGPTCLKMVASYHGKRFSLEYLRDLCAISRKGVSLEGIVEGAEKIGIEATPIKMPLYPGEKHSFQLIPLPCIVHWNQDHFIVVYKATKSHIWISDPSSGKVRFSLDSFKRNWMGDGDTGIALILEPTSEFHTPDFSKIDKTKYEYLFSYLKPYRKYIIQLGIGLILSSLFQLTVPFLTQSLVDIGIQNKNYNFIYLILAGQLMIFFGQTAVTVLQSWIILHVSTRINISLVSDFLVKLMKLPISFFDLKSTGDLIQRIGDHHRIENFLTSASLNIIFSIANFLIFSIVLLIYNSTIFFIFLSAALIYYGWIFIFLKKRREVDHEKFKEMSENQNILIEMIQGMQEIKLQNSEKRRRNKWKKVQARLFKADIRALSITLNQDTGAASINQAKDIFISFVTAINVINGNMTLGMMLAVQYIVGQLNAPLQSMVQFIRTTQDAKISLERLGEIHQNDNKGESQQFYTSNIPNKSSFFIKDLCFRYNKLGEFVLKDMSFSIPHGKVTALVGASGSGKTTLIKLLLGFYQPTQGSISIGVMNLNDIKKNAWREKCGAVLQNSYIFTDTIANNISESEDGVDLEKLRKSVEIANINDYLDSLPMGFNTKLRNMGGDISQGQKQRLLIARAVYKNPEYLFFDEATNSLDATNERVITENLSRFFQKKTVVIAAHRLSTVKNADQIVVLDDGKVIEIGTHQSLIESKGSYYKLVQNQLELGGYTS